MNGREDQQDVQSQPPQVPQAPEFNAPPPRAYAPPNVPTQPVLAADPRSKSPGLAGFLSLIPGLGQVYVGYYKRGFIHAGIIVLLITILANIQDGGLIPLFALPMIFFWLYNVIDAIRRASLFNQYLIGEEEIDLPEDFKMQAVGGSLFGGLLLMGGGFALLMNTRFDVAFDWVEDWWPMAPILIGVYLIGKAIQERNARSAESS